MHRTHTELINVTLNGLSLVLVRVLGYHKHTSLLPNHHFMPFSFSPQISFSFFPLIHSGSPCYFTKKTKQKQTRKNFSCAPSTIYPLPTCFNAYMLCLPSCYYGRTIGVFIEGQSLTYGSDSIPSCFLKDIMQAIFPISTGSFLQYTNRYWNISHLGREKTLNLNSTPSSSNHSIHLHPSTPRYRNCFQGFLYYYLQILSYSQIYELIPITLSLPPSLHNSTNTQKGPMLFGVSKNDSHIAETNVILGPMSSQ